MAASLAFALSASAQDVTVQAGFDRRQVLPGEVVSYTITVSGSTLARTRSQPQPNFADFDVLAGPSTSRSHEMRIVNGNMSQREINYYSWRLVPKREGVLVVPAVSVEVNGLARPSPAAQIQVANPLPGMQSRPDPRGPPGVPDPFGAVPPQDPDRARAEGSRPWSQPPGQVPRGTLQLDVRVEDREPYVGEEIVVSHVLSFTQNVASYGEKGPAEFPGFSKVKHENVKTESRAVKDPATGIATHSEAELARWTLVPLSAGAKALPPHGYVFTLAARDPMEQLFGGGRQVTRETPQVTVTVKPLPDGAPTTFSGAVGSFQASAKLEGSGPLKAGDATALVLEVRGRGSLDNVAPVQLVLPQGIKSFDPEITQDVRRGADGHAEGVKRFRYPLLISEAGRHEVPPIAWAFFDPRTGRYVERLTDALVVEAAPGEVSPVQMLPAVATTQTVEMRASDIRHLRTSLGAWQPDVGLRPLPRWSWALLLAGPLANLLVAGARLVRRLRPMDEATRRAQGASRRAKHRLAEARAAVKAGNPAGAADLVARAVAGFVSDRLQLGAELAPAEAGRALAASSRPDAADRASRLLSDCDFIRFGSSGTGDDATRLADEAEALLRDLPGLRPAPVPR
jgi:hypothetical protein